MKRICSGLVLTVLVLMLSSCTAAVKTIDEQDPLSTILHTPSTIYNNDLAIIAGELSRESEDVSDQKIRQKMSEYGILCYRTDQYGTRYFGGGASAVGVSRIRAESGKETIVVVLVARGSTTASEFLGDWVKGGTTEFLGRKVYQNVYDFGAKLWNNLNRCLSRYAGQMKGKDVKILVTGHSLGGAAACMVAAKLTKGIEDGEWWSKIVDQEDIYGYTFEGISVLSDGQNISDGYENIHNIYNYYDSYGPNGNLSWTGASSIDAKFGHTELFYKNDPESGGATWDSCNNHLNYMDALYEPKKYDLETCTGVNIRREIESVDSEEVSIDEWVSEEEPVIEETLPEELSLEPEEEVYDGTSVPEGTYISNDEFQQEFTFYGKNGVTLSAFGITANGTYEIHDGRINIYYEFLGEQEWSPSFSMEGDSIYIAGTEFIRE